MILPKERAYNVLMKDVQNLFIQYVHLSLVGMKKFLMNYRMVLYVGGYIVHFIEQIDQILKIINHH